MPSGVGAKVLALPEASTSEPSTMSRAPELPESTKLRSVKTTEPSPTKTSVSERS